MAWQVGANIVVDYAARIFKVEEQGEHARKWFLYKEWESGLGFNVCHSRCVDTNIAVYQYLCVDW